MRPNTISVNSLRSTSGTKSGAGTSLQKSLRPIYVTPLSLQDENVSLRTHVLEDLRPNGDAHLS